MNRIRPGREAGDAGGGGADVGEGAPVHRDRPRTAAIIRRRRINRTHIRTRSISRTGTPVHRTVMDGGGEATPGASNRCWPI